MHKKQTSQQNHKTKNLCILFFADVYLFVVFSYDSIFLCFFIHLSLNKRKQRWFHAQTFIFVAKFQSNHSLNDLKFTLRYDNRWAYRTQYNALFALNLFRNVKRKSNCLFHIHTNNLREDSDRDKNRFVEKCWKTKWFQVLFCMANRARFSCMLFL